MALPEKQYYSFQDLAERWRYPVKDLYDYAQEGVIEVHVWLGKVYVEIFYYENADLEWPDRVPLEQRWFNHYVILKQEDLREVIRAGRCAVSRFACLPATNDPTPTFVDIIRRKKPYTIELRDLMISRSERDKIEKAYGLSGGAAAYAAEPSAPRYAHMHDDEVHSFPGRPTVMHLILDQMEARARQGVLCAGPTEESEALRQWALAHIRDAQVPQRKSIYNRIYKRYDELAMLKSETAA